MSEIEIPERLAHLPLRGKHPVPPVFGIDGNGVPDFTVIDPEKWIWLVVNERCHMCGDPLEKPCFFVGGPVSAETGCYQDGPMHRECAEYALKVCPFLAMGKGYATRPPRVLGRGDLPVQEVDRFGLVGAEGYRPARHEDTVILVALNHTVDSWWEGGQRV